ncbi:MAG: hypothetical protein J0M24_17380 [Verrucomicrobia bacterium]|nr:hypothetical protein [Verrucomicrobiota bacterium]
MTSLRRSFAPLALAGLVGGGAGSVAAQVLTIPNGSFESPKTLFAGVFLDSWQKFPKPPWYDESGPFLWDQVSGAFKNTAPGSFDHIVNLDGTQAAFVFAIPEAGFFQDYDSKDWNDSEPSRAFDVRFEVGKAYQLTAGIIGGGGNMREGATLDLSLYFRNDAGVVVPVGLTTITNRADLTPGRTNQVDFVVRVPVVQATDPWAGRHLGIQVRSTTPFELEGGYWDVDHMRLEALPEPTVTLKLESREGQVRLSWESLAGWTYQLQTSSNLEVWTDWGAPLPGTEGELEQWVPADQAQPTMFRVRASAR